MIPTHLGEEFPFANCFVCGESGHLARACPDNPRGLYPKGENWQHFLFKSIGKVSLILTVDTSYRTWILTQLFPCSLIIYSYYYCTCIYMYIYYIFCVDISVIKLWIKMIPVKWYDIISLQWNDIISLHIFKLSSQIDCNNLFGSIGLHRYILADNWHQIWREELLCSLTMLSCTSTWWLDFS